MLFKRKVSATEFEFIIQEYGNDILRFCIYYMDNNVHDGEDAFQETMIKAFRSFDKFRGDSSAKTWLIRIAINTCKDIKKSFRMRFVDLYDTLPDIAVNDIYSTDDIVYESIVELDDIYREAIFLKYYQDLSAKQISEVLNLTLPATNSRIFRAKEELRDILKRKGVDLDG